MLDKAMGIEWLYSVEKNVKNQWGETVTKILIWQSGQTFRNVRNVQHVWNVGNVPGRVRSS